MERNTFNTWRTRRTHKSTAFCSTATQTCDCLEMPQPGLTFLLGQCITFLFCIATWSLYFWLCSASLQETSLSHIPGPKWAAWTRLWIVKTLASGDSAGRFVKVNRRHGTTFGPSIPIPLTHFRLSGSHRTQPSPHQRPDAYT